MRGLERRGRDRGGRDRGGRHRGGWGRYAQIRQEGRRLIKLDMDFLMLCCFFKFKKKKQEGRRWKRRERGKGREYTVDERAPGHLMLTMSIHPRDDLNQHHQPQTTQTSKYNHYHPSHWHKYQQQTTITTPHTGINTNKQPLPSFTLA